MLKYFAIFLFYTVSINAQTLDSLIISEFKAVKEFALITGFASLKEKSNIKNKSIELEVSPKIKSKFDSININITNVGKMTSFQNGQINFNTIEFSKHYDYYFEDELMLKLLIQFYVAHELAHQVQFIKYKKNNIKIIRY